MLPEKNKVDVPVVLLRNQADLHQALEEDQTDLHTAAKGNKTDFQVMGPGNRAHLQAMMMEEVEHEAAQKTHHRNWQNVLVELQEVMNDTNSAEESTVGSTSQMDVDLQNLPLYPAVVCCPSCHQHITTVIKHKVGRTSILLCYVSVFLGCVAGCCLLPFCLDCMKDVSHVCPACHSEICTIHRL